MSLIVIDPIKKLIAADHRLSEGMCRGNPTHKIREFKKEGVILGFVGGVRDFTVACRYILGMKRNGIYGEELAWSLAEHLAENGVEPAHDAPDAHIVLIDKKQGGSAWFIENTRAVLPMTVVTAMGHGSIAAYALLDAGHKIDEVFKVVSLRDNTVSHTFDVITW